MIKMLKKGAMFGLCRVLRQQSGRLFLTSSQSVDSKETRVEHQFKRAAMFGLDARITLVIFITLGTIGYAGFYSAISKTNATGYITDMESIKQAYSHFRTDTNYKLSSYTNPYYYNISELVTLAKDDKKPYTKKYNGPYLGYHLTGTTNFISHPVLKHNIAFVSRSLNTDWAMQAHPDVAKCTSDDCFIWLVVYNVKPEIAKEIDREIDGEQSNDTGKIRLIANSDNYDIFTPIIAE